MVFSSQCRFCSLLIEFVQVSTQPSLGSQCHLLDSFSIARKTALFPARTRKQVPVDGFPAVTLFRARMPSVLRYYGTIVSPSSL